MDLLFSQTQSAQWSGLLSFLPFLLIMAILYFFMLRPQAKKQKDKELMISNLSKGDKIITMGGIYGTVQGIKEKNRKAVIKVDNNTNITINMTAIAGLAEKIKDEELEQA